MNGSSMWDYAPEVEGSGPAPVSGHGAGHGPGHDGRAGHGADTAEVWTVPGTYPAPATALAPRTPLHIPNGLQLSLRLLTC